MPASISATCHPSLCYYYSHCGLKNKEFQKTVKAELRHCPSEAITCWTPARSFLLLFNLFPHSKCTYINWGKDLPFCITNSCIFQPLLAKRLDQMKCTDKSKSATRNGNCNQSHTPEGCQPLLHGLRGQLAPRYAPRRSLFVLDCRAHLQAPGWLSPGALLQQLQYCYPLAWAAMSLGRGVCCTTGIQSSCALRDATTGKQEKHPEKLSQASYAEALS